LKLEVDTSVIASLDEVVLIPTAILLIFIRKPKHHAGPRLTLSRLIPEKTRMEEKFVQWTVLSLSRVIS